MRGVKIYIYIYIIYIYCNSVPLYSAGIIEKILYNRIVII